MTDDYTVTFARELTDEELEGLRNSQDIRYIDTAPNGSFFTTTPNDTYFPDQWYLDNAGSPITLTGFDPGCGDTTTTSGYDINAPIAWDDVLAPGCKIGLIDTGVRASHEDLYGSLDTVLGESDDACGHGTATSGLIAAAGNNGVGIAGVARPDYTESSAQLVVLYAGTNGACNISNADASLSQIANSGSFEEVRVVNESFGGQPCYGFHYYPTQRDAHRNAYVQGLAIIAAAGNFVWNCGGAATYPIYPAAYDHLVLAVTGVDANGQHTFLSSSWNDLAAPSNIIVTTDYSDDDAYQGHGGVPSYCGTSFSAPLTTGSAAMLLGVEPDLTNDDIYHVLEKSALDLGSAGRDDDYGWGLLQLDAAVDYVKSPRKLYHATTSSFTADSIATRTESFANTPFNSAGDTWESFTVHVYQCNITASFAGRGIGEAVVDAWPRPRVSTGLTNVTPLDVLTLTSDIEVVSVGANSMTMRTWTYRVFALGGSPCLGWYPIKPSGTASCGATASLAKFDYSYITEPALPRAEAPNRGIEWRIVSGVVEFEIEGRDANSIEVVDVVGRRIWRRELGLEDHAAKWNPAGTPRGVYFARVNRASGATATKVLVIP